MNKSLKSIEFYYLIFLIYIILQLILMLANYTYYLYEFLYKYCYVFDSYGGLLYDDKKLFEIRYYF